MGKVRRLSDDQFHHLQKIAAGLLTQTDGDLREAMGLALAKHYDLIRTIRDTEIVADVGPGNAILFVPEEGGMAMRVERHPRAPTEETEEAILPEVDLFGFQVIETPTRHHSEPRLDAGVLGVEDWED